MRISDIKAYMKWKEDTSKPHPWFDKHVKPANEKRKGKA